MNASRTRLELAGAEAGQQLAQRADELAGRPHPLVEPDQAGGEVAAPAEDHADRGRRSGSRSSPPASAMAAAATSSAMSWSGSVPATEAGMMPNRVTSNSASVVDEPAAPAVDPVGGGRARRGPGRSSPRPTGPAGRR